MLMDGVIRMDRGNHNWQQLPIVFASYFFFLFFFCYRYGMSTLTRCR
jgi:hypothetical protein